MRPKYFYIVFRAGKPLLPWVPRDYAHCLALWFRAPNWMAVEYVKGGGFTVTPVPPEKGDRFFASLLETSTEVIKVASANERLRPWPVMTCVTVCAQMIGVRTGIWLNPKAFRDYLVHKRAGQPMEINRHGCSQ